MSKRDEKIRKGVDVNKTNWDLDKIYRDDAAMAIDVQALRERIEKLNENQGAIPERLGQILEDNTAGQRLIEKLLTHARMRRDENTDESKWQRIALEMEGLYAEFQSASSYIEPALMALKPEEIEGNLTNEQYAYYERKLEQLRRFLPHILSKEEEFILSAMDGVKDGPTTAYSMLMDADLEYPTMDTMDGMRLTDSNYLTLLKNPKAEVREEAFQKMYQTLETVKNTVAANLYTHIKRNTIEAKLRKYPSVREMELFRDDVGLSVYDNLISVVEEYLPVLHKYYMLRKEALGLSEQHMYDVYLPLSETNQENIPYDEAVQTVVNALAPLGEEYVDQLYRGTQENWIDVYPRDKKTGGAYSWGTYDTDPYILMNYTGDLEWVFTLAHELGHSMHSYYSRKVQPYLYSGYPIFLAEVASTTNEILLSEYLIERAENIEEKLRLINHFLDGFKGTVFRQTMFATFEREIYQRVESGEALTAEDFSAIYRELNRKYYGDAVIQDEEIQREWMRIPHFFMTFYVYKYATGFSAATYLAGLIRKGDPEDRDRYLRFLGGGGYDSPLVQLEKVGADMSSPERVREALQVFEAKVEELEQLLQMKSEGGSN
ncbi:MAG: oligoendopeptidase F [Tissierellia bacterium]|nr:oligoendopeptidase F [Tissierellia bacterium]